MLANREAAAAAGRLTLPQGGARTAQAYDPATDQTRDLPALAAGSTVLDALVVPANGNTILIITEG